MTKRRSAILLLISTICVLFSSCVTQPHFSDYVGMTKEEAQDDLTKPKTGNTIMLVLNWLFWGPLGLWIPSIVDTVNVISYSQDFAKIERKLDAVPNGAKVTP